MPKLFLWLLFTLFLWLGLMVYAFSYWGERGMGDYARIPIGYGQEIGNIDGVHTYIEGRKNKKDVYSNIYTYTIEGKYVCGESENRNWFVYNMQIDELKTFINKETYIAYASSNNLPLPNSFKGFDEHYNQYWDGWRFWLLP